MKSDTVCNAPAAAGFGGGCLYCVAITHKNHFYVLVYSSYNDTRLVRCCCCFLRVAFDLISLFFSFFLIQKGKHLTFPKKRAQVLLLLLTAKDCFFGLAHKQIRAYD